MILSQSDMREEFICRMVGAESHFSCGISTCELGAGMTDTPNLSLLFRTIMVYNFSDRGCFRFDICWISPNATVYAYYTRVNSISLWCSGYSSIQWAFIPEQKPKEVTLHCNSICDIIQLISTDVQLVWKIWHTGHDQFTKYQAALFCE